MERYSPEERAAMRAASRSPNKRGGSEREPQPVAADAPLQLELATPFKRFRVNALISPTKSSSSSGSLDALAARRRGFQSLADDRFPVTIKSIPTGATTAAADATDTESAASTQQSSQEALELRKARECSPADVAELLACSETLEERMDALDVGSFLSWRPPSPERAATSSSSPKRHRRKPRIHFADDLSLHDVFGDETQLVSDDEEDVEAEPEPPVLIAVAHFPLDGCCACSDPDCGADLERFWQVYTPPPHPGFDPKCCSADSDYDDDDDDDADDGEDTHLGA